MKIFDQYSGAKKYGYQVYRKKFLLIHYKLIDVAWEYIKLYISEEKSDYQIAKYLGDNGTTASYLNYYFSKSNLPYIEEHLKTVWKTIQYT